MSDPDPVLETLIKMQQRLDTALLRIDELERLLQCYFELTRALRTGIPPSPLPSVN
jgi:hypothetical protein